jgi:hypothetical protein
MTLWTVETKAEAYDLSGRVHHGRLTEPAVDLSQAPRADLTLENSGVTNEVLTVGTQVDIKRGNELVFPGVVETPLLSSDGQGDRVETTLIHEGYQRLRQLRCLAYQFDESGGAHTTRDGVRVNPWNWPIVREPGSALDENGQELAAAGVTLTEAVEALVGTQLVLVAQQRDNRWLRPSNIYTTGNKLRVYQDDTAGDERPALQRRRDGGDGFVATTTSDTVETIPMENGPRAIEQMGDVTKAKVVLIGVRDASKNDPSVEACRNARKSTRTYSRISLTHTQGVNGTGLDKWEGTVDLTGDGASQKNSVGLRLSIPGSGGSSDTTRVLAIKLVATTTSDTGVTIGTAETYQNPVTFTAGDENFVDVDLLGRTRLNGLAQVRSWTESDGSANPSPHWDIHIDANLDAHFQERRGATVTGHTYGPGDANVTMLDHEFYGADVAHQVQGLGAGKGRSRVQTAPELNATDFDNGGLRHPENDPDGAARYGRAARTMVWRNEGQQDPGALLREARAFAKLHEHPRERVEMTVRGERIRYFATGDEIQLDHPRTRSNSPHRVQRIEREWGDAIQELVKVTLGENPDRVLDRLRSAAENARNSANRPQPGQAVTGLNGQGTQADAFNWGIYSFAISDGQAVDRVLLEMTTLPWTAGARPSEHAHSVDVEHPSHSHTVEVTHPAHSHTVEVTHPAHNHTVEVTHPAHNHSISTTSGGGGGTITSPIQSDGSSEFVASGTSNTWTHDIPNADGNGILASVSVESNNNDEFEIEIICKEKNHDNLPVFAVGGVVKFDTDLLVSFFVPTRYEGGTLEVNLNNPSSSSDATFDADVVDFWEISNHAHAVDDTSTTELGTTSSETSSEELGTTQAETSDAALGTTQAETTESSGGLNYGIFQFTGDQGGQNDDPVYAKDLEWGVDVDTDAAGIPNDWANDRDPMTWGKRLKAQTVRVDITGYLERNAQNLIKSGVHHVYIKGVADTGGSKENQDGLTHVSITPIIKTREEERV